MFLRKFWCFLRKFWCFLRKFWCFLRKFLSKKNGLENFLGRAIFTCLYTNFFPRSIDWFCIIRSNGAIMDSISKRRIYRISRTYSRRTKSSFFTRQLTNDDSQVKSGFSYSLPECYEKCQKSVIVREYFQFSSVMRIFSKICRM